MASNPDRQVNSSPAKRLKLDHTDLLSDSSVEISIGSVPAPGKPSQVGFDPEMGPHQDVLDGGGPRLGPTSSLSLGRPRASIVPPPSTFDIGIGIVSTAAPGAEDVQEEVGNVDHNAGSLFRGPSSPNTQQDRNVSLSFFKNAYEWKPGGWVQVPDCGVSSFSLNRGISLSISADAEDAEEIEVYERDSDDDSDEVSSTLSSFSDYHLGANPTNVPLDMDERTLWKAIGRMLGLPPRRSKLRNVNTLEDAVGLIKSCSRIIVLTGAGVSVSCGIPDFRSRDGIYSRLAVDFPDLRDPQAMFDIGYFSRDPRPFFKFAKEIYPGQFKPSVCHRFIKKIEDQGKLLRNYSQNIDTLEHVTGIKNLIECHGSFSSASCTRCKHKVTAEEIREDIMQQKIPLCPKCFQTGLTESCSALGTVNYSKLFKRGIMKPDIVFFGEGLSEAFHDALAADTDKCDLIIVIGSSLKVRPVALIPNSIPQIPQILINREPLPHLRFDIELLGDGDVIINQLCHLLGGEWSDLCSQPALSEAGQLLPPPAEKVEERVTETTSFYAQKSIKTVEPDICANLSSDEGVNRVLKEVIPETSVNHVVELSNEEILSVLEDPAVASEKNNIEKQVKLRHVSVDSISDSDIEAGLSCDLKEADADTKSRVATSVANCGMPGSAKERHMSLDSTRDSGIGESCNSVDSSVDKKRDVNIESINEGTSYFSNKAEDSLALRLPDNCFHFVPPSRYIFPGAEVYVEKCDSSSESGSDFNDSSDESFDNVDNNDSEHGDQKTKETSSPHSNSL